MFLKDCFDKNIPQSKIFKVGRVDKSFFVSCSLGRTINATKIELHFITSKLDRVNK